MVQNPRILDLCVSEPKKASKSFRLSGTRTNSQASLAAPDHLLEPFAFRRFQRSTGWTRHFNRSDAGRNCTHIEGFDTKFCWMDRHASRCTEFSRSKKYRDHTFWQWPGHAIQYGSVRGIPDYIPFSVFNAPFSQTMARFAHSTCANLGKNFVGPKAGSG
jgi:hypothetical protein